jgi:hypothetical protein
MLLASDSDNLAKRNIGSIISYPSLFFLSTYELIHLHTVKSSAMDPDPVGLADPNPYPSKPNVNLNYTISRKFQSAVHNIRNYDTWKI